MKLTFLGTATSTGIPVLGCDCGVCHSADPRDHRLRCSSLITTDGGKHLLVDCGPDVRQQLLTHHNAPVDAVIITHSHYDHVGGLDDLRTLSYRDAAQIYCEPSVAADIRRLLPYCFNNSGYPNVPRLELNEIEPFREFKAADLTINPLRIIHGKLPILGFRIGTLAYITDATNIPDESLREIAGIDTLVINALRLTPNPTHMNLAEALDVISAVRPRKAYLIHMSHQMGLHAEASRRLPAGVSLAYDGLEIDI